MKLLQLFLLLFTLKPLALQAQQYLQGYVSDVSGTRFTYHSPLPNVESSLLSRANAAFDPISWKTEVVPADYTSDEVSFIWLYGMDVLPESQRFDLSVNHQHWFTFYSPKDNDADTWSVSGLHGASLTFHRTMIDKHKDQMGFVIMKLPVAAITRGSPAIISVDGDDAESNAWFMTFKTQLREGVSISQNKVVVKKEDQRFHVARFDFIHLSDATQATISVQGSKSTHHIYPGHTAVDIELPKAQTKTSHTALIRIGNGRPQRYSFVLEPIREWTIYLVQHTHTDIGYTRSQTEIMAEHLRYIDNALDYCDQSDHYPPDAQFRWTCEASWAVKEYLQSRPQAQIDRLLRRIKEGRIEVTSMYFNFCDIVDETALAMQTKTLRLFKEHGIDVRTAMQNDVNGIGWCMIDFYDQTDVRYVTMGQHGHRAHVPFDKPTAFWWESPAGNQLLAYRSEHYMHGNALALTSGYLDGFRANLSLYLDKLELKGYPYDRTAFQFSGYVTDNSPPSIGACDIVKEWNERYEWPRLRMALANEFMIYLDKHEASTLQSKRQAWPDWWTDGFGSAMIETKVARNAHADMIANMGLVSLARLMGAHIPVEINKDIQEAYDQLLFYDEHTFGAAESITDPMTENSVVQWGEKSAYAWDAMKQAGLLREKALGQLQSFIDASDTPQLAVYNTLNWPRSGLVKVFIDHAIAPANQQFRIVDGSGNEMQAALMSSRSDGSYWNIWVKDIPALGFKTFRIENTSSKEEKPHGTSALPVLENAFYRIVIDTMRGGVRSLYDKELQRELIDQKDSVLLGEFIYERLANRQALERLTNTNRDTIYVPLDRTWTKLSDVHVSQVEEGNIWQSIRIKGSSPACADHRGINMEIRLFHDEKRIDFLFDMYKLQVDAPEAVYIAFPFQLDKAHLAFDVQGGTVIPGVNQLEGTASDWNAIQNFAAVRNENQQILFSSPDIPLVQFGAINTGRFYYTYKPATTHIYSWVLNNYWTTNFKKSQSGEMKWSYTITSKGDPRNSVATRFGFASRIPLLARALPPGKKSTSAEVASFMRDCPDNLQLISIKPSMDNVDDLIIHLREIEGMQAVVDIEQVKTEMHAMRVSQVNVLEEEIQTLTEYTVFEPYESRFLKIHLQQQNSFK